MKFSFNIIDWQAAAPGLDSDQAWLAWSLTSGPIDKSLPMKKAVHLPMMAARRLTIGSLAAVDAAMALLAKHEIDAVVFASRHGELERNFRILSGLAKNETPSPTDFTMSVHNAAVGSFTIAVKKPIVSSSIAAGEDTFHQALLEVQGFFAAGYTKVLLVDFDGSIPEYYWPYLDADSPVYPWAVALLLEAGNEITCESHVSNGKTLPMPQAIQFLRNWLARTDEFSIVSERHVWKWVI